MMTSSESFCASEPLTTIDFWTQHLILIIVIIVKFKVNANQNITIFKKVIYSVEFLSLWSGAASVVWTMVDYKYEQKGDINVHPSHWFLAVQHFLWCCRVLITAAVEKNVRAMYSRFLSRRVFSAISQSHHGRGGTEHEERPTLLRKKCLKGITDNGTNRQWNGI